MAFGIVIAVAAVLEDEHIRRFQNALVRHVRRRERIFRCVRDRAEILALQRRLHDQRQIARRGIVALVVQTVRIHEVRVRTAQLVGAFVHHLHKILDRPADVLRDGVRRLVAGLDHHAVQQILQPQLLADLKIRRAAPGDEICIRILRDRHRVREVPVLQRQQTRHDLRQARGINLLVRVLLIDRPPVFRLDQQRAFAFA